MGNMDKSEGMIRGKNEKETAEGIRVYLCYLFKLLNKTFDHPRIESLLLRMILGAVLVLKQLIQGRLGRMRVCISLSSSSYISICIWFACVYMRPYSANGKRSNIEQFPRDLENRGGGQRPVAKACVPPPTLPLFIQGVNKQRVLLAQRACSGTSISASAVRDTR